MSLYSEIARELKEAGFEMVRRGKGSHTIFNKKGCKRPIVVSWNMRDRNMASTVLKQAGLWRI